MLRRGQHVTDVSPGMGSTNEECPWGTGGHGWKVPPGCSSRRAVHCVVGCVSCELEDHGLDSGCR